MNTLAHTPPAPRHPTTEELAQLWEWLRSQEYFAAYSFTEENWLNDFVFAVFDRYVTAGPGYGGKVIYMIWSGWPDQIEVFRCDGGRLLHDSSHGAERCHESAGV